MRAFMNWSGGKDSALSFYKAKQNGISVNALVTTINTSTDRISMHGVRRELLEAQAFSIGLPLHTIELHEMPGMEAYETTVRNSHQRLKTDGCTHGIFGDLFLEDLKQYREGLLAKDGLQCLFPIWKMETRDVLQELISLGFKAVIVCVNSAHLDKSFCGRELNEAFLNDLPANVDPCGENGEYHSFVYDGPIFSYPITFQKGDIVFKEYAAPKQDDCFDTPQPAAGFYFQDLQKP